MKKKKKKKKIGLITINAAVSFGRLLATSTHTHTHTHAIYACQAYFLSQDTPLTLCHLRIQVKFSILYVPQTKFVCYTAQKWMIVTRRQLLCYLLYYLVLVFFYIGHRYIPKFAKREIIIARRFRMQKLFCSGTCIHLSSV